MTDSFLFILTNYGSTQQRVTSILRPLQFFFSACKTQAYECHFRIREHWATKISMFALYSQHHFGLYKHHIVLFWLFWGKVLLCSHSWSGTHYIDKAILELTRIPLICLEGMGLQTCSATAGLMSILNSYTWSASPLLVVYKLGIHHYLLESVKYLSLTYALLNLDFWSTQHCWILVLRLRTGPLWLCSGGNLSESSPSVIFLLHSDS